MKSLQAKLTITFLVVSIAGTLLTTLIVYLSNRRAFNELRSEQRTSEFVEEVVAYYEANGSWENAAVELRNQIRTEPEPFSPFSGRPPELPPIFALIDLERRVIIPNPELPLAEVVSEEVLSTGVALEVDGERVGTLLVDERSPIPIQIEAAIIAQANRALIFGALGGTALAVVLAIFISQMVTKPLRELAIASHDLAHGHLEQSVPVRTQDELGELASAFNYMSAELGRLNQVRQQMTADIAHDLGTPLTVLSGYLEAMEDGTLATTPERLHMMRQEVKILQRLVEDLSTLTLADAGRLTLFKEIHSIRKLLDQVRAVYIHQAEQKGVQLLVGSAEEMPAINLDPARMRQALGNLVSNALRYTPSGGSVTLSAIKLDGKTVEMSVSDTGSGISAEDLPHIFNRFYRADRSRQEGKGGSGLGLAIAKSLIVAHGGKIEADSTLGMGTKFKITL